MGTDAHLPGFGDRLRVDVLGPGGTTCGECSRTFDVGESNPFPVSFGIVPAGDHPLLVRARLYRAEATDGAGEPHDPILDALGRLPQLESSPLELQLVLGMSCFGKPVNLANETACDPASGVVGPVPTLLPGGAESLPKSGSWLGGDEPCTQDAPLGMLCIPGGPFQLGSVTHVPFGPYFDPVPVQLVRLSAFYLDIDEMTVGTYRTLIGGEVSAPQTEDQSHPFCPFTLDVGPNEGASVSCLSHMQAEAACAALGRRLPTEAEWEFAAGGRALETAFPWPVPDASNVALCEHAVLGRGVFGDNAASRICINEIAGLIEGPVSGGSNEDITSSGLHDMGGNLAEWVADDFTSYSDAGCWGPDFEVRENPRCELGAPEASVRGGSWVTFPHDSHVYFRRGAPKAARFHSVGVRCALDAK